MSNMISVAPSPSSNVTNSVVISQENTTSVSASFSALPGIQISGNGVANVYYNQVPTQSSQSALCDDYESRKGQKTLTPGY